MATKFLYIYLKDEECFEYFNDYIQNYNRRKDMFNRMEGVILPKIELVQIYRDDIPDLLEKREKIIFVGNTLPQELGIVVPERLYQSDGIQIKEYFSFFIQLDVDEKIAHNKDAYRKLLENVGREQRRPGMDSEHMIAKVIYSGQGLSVHGLTEKRILSRSFGQKAFMYGLVPFGFVLDAPIEKKDDLYAKNQAIKYGLLWLENNYILTFMEIDMPKVKL